MSGGPFHEDYLNPAADPLHPQTMDFPRDEVFARLDGDIPKDVEPLDATTRTKLVEAFGKIFFWVTATDLSRKDSDRRIGKRFIALCWVMNPGLFEGSPSATKLAEIIRMPACKFHSLTGEAAREFGITNRAQDHAWNRKGDNNDHE